MRRRLSIVWATIFLLGAAGTAGAATRVVVLPFAGSTPVPARDAWISQAAQQNVIMTLGQSRGLQPVASAGAAPAVVDAAIASKAAKTAGAELAIFGTYEVLGDQIRLTAQLVTGSGQTLGTAQVAGGAERLLSLEDELSDQLRVLLGNPAPALIDVANLAAPPAPPLPQVAPAPIVPAIYDPWVGSRNYFATYSTYGLGPYYPYGYPVSHGGLGYGSFSRTVYAPPLGLSWSVRGDNWFVNFNGGAGQGRRSGGLSGGHRGTSR